MILREFISKNKNSFELLRHGEIEFFDKELIEKQVMDENNKIHIHKEYKRKLISGDDFQHLYDLYPYYDYVLIDSRIDIYTKYKLHSYEVDNTQCFIYLKLYGKKYIKGEQNADL
ncbi:MAG: hypothetical protein WCR97_03975 [Bacilli bacterium]